MTAVDDQGSFTWGPKVALTPDDSLLKETILKATKRCAKNGIESIIEMDAILNMYLKVSIDLLYSNNESTVIELRMSEISQYVETPDYDTRVKISYAKNCPSFRVEGYSGRDNKPEWLTAYSFGSTKGMFKDIWDTLWGFETYKICLDKIPNKPELSDPFIESRFLKTI